MTNNQVENLQQHGALNGARGSDGEVSPARVWTEWFENPFHAVKAAADAAGVPGQFELALQELRKSATTWASFDCDQYLDDLLQEVAGATNLVCEQDRASKLFRAAYDGAAPVKSEPLNADEQGASERDAAREILSGYVYQRVADLYDHDSVFANALRVLVGPEFEYPDYSHLMVRQAISKADRQFASSAAANFTLPEQQAIPTEARTMDEGKALLDQALAAIGGIRTTWEERDRLVSPWEYCLVTLPKVLQTVSVGVSAGGVISVAGVPFSPNSRKLNVWVQEIQASLEAWRAGRLRWMPPLELVRTDRDNFRVYYRRGETLYAFQAEGRDQFQLFECTRDGEPMYVVPMQPLERKPDDYPEFGNWVGREFPQAVAGSLSVAETGNPLEYQFPRLLAEVFATQDLNMESLASSMDLTVEEVRGLFVRADEAWEAIKAEKAPVDRLSATGT